MAGKIRASGWVGRSIRRVEDPALLRGQGTFTADLPATHRVKFVRSAVSCGRINGITRPERGMVFTAADLADVKPIIPILEKFDYVKIAQPILATDAVRFVGEPIVAVVAATEADAEDLAEDVVVDIEETPPVTDALSALAPDAPRVHTEAVNNVVVRGVVESPNLRSVKERAQRVDTL